VVVVLVPVVPDCSHDARNAMAIRTAIRENKCFFIDILYFAPRRGPSCLKPKELLGMDAPDCVIVRLQNQVSLGAALLVGAPIEMGSQTLKLSSKFVFGFAQSLLKPAQKLVLLAFRKC